MVLPHNYPFSPPEVQFLTRFYHCNVNSMGQVCLPLLRNSERSSVSLSSPLVPQTPETSLSSSSIPNRPVSSQLTSVPVFRNVSLASAPAEHEFLVGYRQNRFLKEPVSSPSTPLSTQPPSFPAPSSQTNSYSASRHSSSLRWAPSLGIRSILYGLLNLFYECNPDDPLVGSVAQQYRERRKQHDDTARLWTLVFASQMPPPAFSRERTSTSDDADTEDSSPSVKRSRPEGSSLHLSAPL